MMRLTEDQTSYAWLDAAQLIKHAFGLARTFHGRKAILLYLFWEPTNASSFSVFDEHRREISDFSGRMLGGFPEFRAMSYGELWKDWESGRITAKFGKAMGLHDFRRAAATFIATEAPENLRGANRIG